MKEYAARTLAALIALLTIANSLMNIFVPESQFGNAQLEPQSIAGLSSFRVGMGSPFLMAGLFAGYVALKAKREALIPIMVFFGCVLFARMVGFVADGFDERAFRFTILAAVVFSAAAASFYLLPNQAKPD